jgi:hypothetical protein
MDCKICPKCEARWFEGKHMWSTGANGSEADLAGLVCDNLSEEDKHLCINPKRGTDHGGDTWEKRSAAIDALQAEMERKLDEFKEDQL